MDHLNDEFSSGSGSGFDMRFALGHGRHDIGRVIRHFVDRRALRLKAIGPRALVFKFAVHGLPTLALFLGVEEGELCSFVHRDIGAAGDLQESQDVLRLFLHPLIAADGGDAEDVELLRLQEYENGLLVAGSGAAGVLIDDDFDFLGRGSENKKRNNNNEECRPTLAKRHDLPRYDFHL